jgi:hypothetical protein
MLALVVLMLLVLLALIVLMVSAREYVVMIKAQQGVPRVPEIIN